MELAHVARFPFWQVAGASRVVRRIGWLCAATYRLGCEFQSDRHDGRASVVLPKRAIASYGLRIRVYPECAIASHGPRIRTHDDAFPNRRAFPNGRVGSGGLPSD